MNNYGNGYIILYLGSMFSSKTSALYEELIKHYYGGHKSLIIKKKNDNRYSNNGVIFTHDKKYISDNKIKKINDITVYKIQNNIDVYSFECNYLYEANEKIKNFDVILIDEIQFFEDAYIYCDKWANDKKIVICSGLNSTFKRSSFDTISKLIPRVECIINRHSVCRETGNTASFSERLNENNEEISIGGSESYKPVDRITYFNDLNKTKSAYQNYIFNEIIQLADLLKINTKGLEEKIYKLIISNIKDNHFEGDYFEILKKLNKIKN
jgi:thymidine kinase